MQSRSPDRFIFLPLSRRPGRASRAIRAHLITIAAWPRSPSRQDLQPSEAAIVITRPESPISGDFRAVGERQK
jgi:hypothetical protein